jgi:hypothetical protein
MDEKDVATLKETMRIRNRHPGLTGKKKDPILVHVRNMPDVVYCSLDEFLKRLEKRKKTIDIHTLEIKDAKAAPTPKTPTPPKKTTPPTPPAEVPKEKYMKKELEKLTVPVLKKIAGVDPDVNREGKKAELVKKLTGRPKYPIE